MNSKISDVTLLVVRIVVGIVIAGHGAQKLLGWFHGFGYDATMNFFTETMGLPYLLAFAIIVAESIGMIALIAGLFTRAMSGVLIAIMVGAIITVHAQYGFFMNWFGAQAGEGFEYHVLVIALATVTLLNGGGLYSIDNFIGQRYWKKVNATV
jgi:putative oxidoreductase